MESAEALYAADGRTKDDRDQIAGKTFCGWGDHHLIAALTPGAQGWLRPHWWRAGRYLLISIQVSDTNLLLHGLAWEECGLPAERRDHFDAADAELARVLALCARGLFASMHDIYADSPYYEQMMYCADTRIEMLLTYLATGEDTLPRCGIELLDLSRDNEGFVAMRFPSADRQASANFAMFWIWMLHDYAHWHDDWPWLRRRLPGMRALLGALRAYSDADGLLVRPPGWLFVDWVPSWSEGWAPGAREGRSALVNLQYLLTLQKAAALERLDGEEALATRLETRAARVGESVRRVFWDDHRQLFADEETRTSFSQHAQIWALLAGLASPAAPAPWAAPSPDAAHADLARATVYFQHYLFEALGRLGRTDWLLEYLEFWRLLARRGLKAPVEGPEPSRSDCHAWGSHPLYHVHCTLAGITPAAPGFARVRIAPQPGPLARLSSEIPHPRGRVVLALDVAGGRAEVALPQGVEGVFVWAGRERSLRSGVSSLTLD